MTDRHSTETAVSQSSPHAEGKSTPENEKATPAHNGNKELKISGDGNIQVSTLDKNALYDPRQESFLTRLGLNLESFKRAPGTTAGHHVVGAADLEAPVDSTMLQQKLKARHLSMIGVGGSIGTGLFIGSGSALADGGPAGIMIAWIIMGLMLLCVVTAMGEMAIMYPVSGGFFTLVGRFVDDNVALANGWLYWFQWAITLPLELTAAGFVIQFWDDQKTINIAVWISIIFAIVLILNLFGTLGFAEEEYWSAVLKLVTIGIFIIAAIVFVCGGGPSGGEFGSYYGARNWHDPGAFANGFKGVCAVFVTAAFSFAGTELVGIAATEHPNPYKAMPGAIKMTFWRIVVVFWLSLFMVTLVVKYDDPRLLGGSDDANASPFVIAFRDAGVSGLPDLVNATVLVSIVSIAMASVYAGSRVLMSLAEQRMAPRCFAYVDKAGRPLWAVVSVLIWFPLAYINLASVGDQVFTWLLAASGLATIFSWLSISIAHIRFRMAWKAQGHSVDELPFHSIGGIWGSVFAATILILVLVAQFYVAVWPIGDAGTPGERAESFFQAYLAVPIAIGLVIVGYAVLRTKPKKLHEIDLVTGRKCHFSAEELNAKRAEKRQWPIGKKILHWLFL